MLSVGVEGFKNDVVGYGCASAVARRVRDFNGWLTTDGRAG
jgi:hypothetical protein